MQCKNCDKNIEIRNEDLEFYKKFDVPAPVLCSDCRLQHRLCFRNERTLYKRTSSLSGQSIISIYHDKSPYLVYSGEEWWSDKHDAGQFAMDFDFNRTFFEQFKELQLKVPRIGLFNVNPVNSTFCQQAYDNKDSYLCVVVENCEDSMYLSHSNKIRTSYDSSYLQDCELCYDCIDSNKLYNCMGCQSCQNSNDLMFCYDCIGCHNCVGCFGLRNKQYYIMNEKYSEEEYQRKIKMLGFNKFSKFSNARNYFMQWTKDLPHRVSRNFNVDNCVGNYLTNCKNAFHCFNSYELQDCAYSTWIFNSHDCFDVYGMGYSELVYECLGVERLNNCAFDTFVSHSADAFYSDLCFNCKNIFGCVGLKSGKFRILNKEYSQADYENLKVRIIEHMKKTGEWGQFFPIALSPYAYNETASQDLFPLDEVQAASKGFKWKEKEVKDYQKSTYQIPDDVCETDVSICSEILACESCGKNFKIQEKEIGFYKRMNIAVPRKCPDCRYFERIALRNPRPLYERTCDKCGAAIETTYAPSRSEKIYCEKCYGEGIG
jgi:hypothetical protein